MELTKRNTDNYSSNFDEQDILIIDDTAEYLIILS